MHKIRINNFWYGKLAEFKAVFHLLLRFYWPIKIRYKTALGEIDLICIHFFTKKIIFIEVKNSKNYSNLYEMISKYQQQRILNAAEIFFKNYPSYCKYDIGFYGMFFYRLRLKKTLKFNVVE